MKSVLIFDETGSAVDLARILSKVVGELYYFKEWVHGGFPGIEDNTVGSGIPGVIRVDDVDILLREKPIDLIIFPDIYRGGKQVTLVQQGRRVFGSRMGEMMEIYRDEFKELLKSVGLSVNPHKDIFGISALREFVKDNKDQYLKINKHRGITETKKMLDYVLMETYFDKLEKDLGSKKNTQKFMMEPKFPPDMVECGLDPMIANGDVPDIVMGGIEIKDLGYYAVVKPYKDFPEFMRKTIDLLGPTFKEYNYCGNFSNEMKVGKELDPFVIDATCRMPNPPGALQWYMYRNLPELYFAIADGIPMSPIVNEPYGLELIVNSEFAKKYSMPIRIPAKFRDNVFLSNYCMREGVNDVCYTIPYIDQPDDAGTCYVGSVVTSGKSFDVARKKMEEICASIEAIDLIFNLKALDNVQEEVKKLDEFGINFYNLEPVKEPEPIPEPVIEKKVVPAKKASKPVSGFLSIINK